MTDSEIIRQVIEIVSPELEFLGKGRYKLCTMLEHAYIVVDHRQASVGHMLHWEFHWKGELFRRGDFIKGRDKEYDTLWPYYGKLKKIEQEGNYTPSDNPMPAWERTLYIIETAWEDFIKKNS